MLTNALLKLSDSSTKGLDPNFVENILHVFTVYYSTEFYKHYPENGNKNVSCIKTTSFCFYANPQMK
jgi:hypothetical protein